MKLTNDLSPQFGAVVLVQATGAKSPIKIQGEHRKAKAKLDGFEKQFNGYMPDALFIKLPSKEFGDSRLLITDDDIQRFEADVKETRKNNYPCNIVSTNPGDYFLSATAREALWVEQSRSTVAADYARKAIESGNPEQHVKIDVNQR